MIGLLQAVPAIDQDRQTIRFVIIALLVVAALLGILTIWYWNQTSPKKRRVKPNGVARSRQPVAEHAYYDDDDFYGDSPSQPAVHQGRDSYINKAPSNEVDPEDAWAALTSAENNKGNNY